MPLSQKFALSVPSPLQLDRYSVARLQDLIQAAGLAHSDCLEKDELRARARQAADVIRSRERERAQHDPSTQQDVEKLVCLQASSTEAAATEGGASAAGAYAAGGASGGASRGSDGDGATAGARRAAAGAEENTLEAR